MRIKRWIVGVLSLALVFALATSVLSTKVHALRIETSIKLVTTGSGNGINDYTGRFVMSLDGTKIVIESTATNVIPGKTTNGNTNLYLYDVASSTTTLITAGSSGLGGDSNSSDPSISPDGTKIIFRSVATDLISGVTANGQANLYLYDVTSATTTLVSAGPTGTGGNNVSETAVSYADPLITADGTKIIFRSNATDLIPGKTTTSQLNVFLYDIASATTTLVSAGSSGMGGNGTSGIGYTISLDGTKIAFNSNATDLIEGMTTNGDYRQDIFLYDVASATTTLVTAGLSGTGGNGSNGYFTMTPDGTKIAFRSNSTDLVDGMTTDGEFDIFLYDVASATTTLVTTGLLGTGGNGMCLEPFISADGSRISLSSYSTDLVEGITTNGEQNVFLYDVASATMTLVTTGGAGTGGNSYSYYTLISADGTKIAFISAATDLISGRTTTNQGNVFLYDIASATTTLVTAGPLGNGGNGSAVSVAISADGNRTALMSYARNLISGRTTTNQQNVFLFNFSLFADVTFDPQNGEATTAVEVPGGSLLDEPTDPVYTGYVFDGWYTSATSTGVLWDFDDPVHGDMTLYAHWRTLYTVTFEPQNGEAAVTVEVSDGSLLDEPTDPTYTGYVFDGWYTSATSTGVLWDFDDPVTEDMTLFAHWTELHTVTFDPQNGEAAVTVEVSDGSLLDEPTDPTYTGYVFDGWYTSATSTGVLWDFDDPVTEDMTLYAHWTEQSSPPIDPQLPQTGDRGFIVPVALLALAGLTMCAVALCLRRRTGKKAGIL